MDLSSVLMCQPAPDRKRILAAYITDVPTDAVRALATVMFLRFLPEPMPEEPDRINMKCGLFYIKMIRCAEWRCNDAQKKPENISYK